MMNLEQKISEASEKMDEYLGKNNIPMHSYYEGKFDAYIDCRQLKQENTELRANIHSLLGAMNLLRDDLLSRGEIDHDGTRVVNCGASAWRVFCNAIDETPAQSLQQIKRDAVLEAVEAIKPSAPRGLFQPYDVPAEYNGFCEAVYAMQVHANNLVKDNDNEK